MDNSTVRLSIASLTDQGCIRTRNEDALATSEGDWGTLLLLSDGIGGCPGGDSASRLAVESVQAYFGSHFLAGEETATLGQSIDFAQQKILEAGQANPELRGMGCTIVLLLIKGLNFWYAHTGDSRLYLARGETLNQLTKDHSRVQEMVESGIITREQARSHPERSRLTRALGAENYKPEISGPHILRQDDVFLLCSDGLTEHVTDEELLPMLEEEPQIAVKNLTDLANGRGGTDNISLHIVHVRQATPHVQQHIPAPRPAPKRFSPSLPVILTLLAFAAALTWYLLSLSRDPSFVSASKPAKKEAQEEAATSKAEGEEAQALPRQALASVENALDEQLRANLVPANNPLRQLMDKLRDPQVHAGKLKFFDNPQNNQLVYILPGNSIYLAYSRLLEKPGYDLNREQIEALLTLALLLSDPARQTQKLSIENWEELLFQSGNAGFDPKLVEDAQNHYKKIDPKSDGLVFSQRLVGKFGKRIRVGNFNIAIDPLKK